MLGWRVMPHRCRNEAQWNQQLEWNRVKMTRWKMGMGDGAATGNSSEKTKIKNWTGYEDPATGIYIYLKTLFKKISASCSYCIIWASWVSLLVAGPNFLQLHGSGPLASLSLDSSSDENSGVGCIFLPPGSMDYNSWTETSCVNRASMGKERAVDMQMGFLRWLTSEELSPPV